MTVHQQNKRQFKAIVTFRKAIISSYPALMAAYATSSVESIKTIPPEHIPKAAKISEGGLDGMTESVGGCDHRKR